MAIEPGVHLTFFCLWFNLVIPPLSLSFWVCLWYIWKWKNFETALSHFLKTYLSFILLLLPWNHDYRPFLPVLMPLFWVSFITDKRYKSCKTSITLLEPLQGLLRQGLMQHYMYSRRSLMLCRYLFLVHSIAFSSSQFPQHAPFSNHIIEILECKDHVFFIFT